MIVALGKTMVMATEIIVRELCPTSTRQWLKTGAVLVDIREEAAAQAVQIAEGEVIYMPIHELMDRYTELPNNKDLIIVCEKGLVSIDAAAFLQNNGYDRVYHMRRGFRHWVAKGYPVSGDTSGYEASTHGCCGKHAHAQPQ